ncbi:MAG: hypothetical protein OEN56_08500, partial [Gemmatimonadota bacterium]|nr:hypothetical protein [Gemmatimonadota bacterium]
MSRPSPVGRLVRGASFALLLAAAVLAGQPRVVEGQISPADTAAVLLEAAREFERDGLWDVAEAIYVHITERYAGTPAAAAARSRLSAPESDRPARASRVELQVFGTTYGLFLGVAVPAAFGANDPEAYGAGLLIGGPLGLFGSRALLRANPVTEGQARAISWGGVWGGWQGFGWTQILDLGVEEICSDFGCYSNEDNEEELFASMIIGSLAGITGGALLARNPIRSGVASGAQGGSIWASIYGAMIAALGDPDGDEVLASALIGGNVGLVAGAALASKFDVSRARVRMINLGALVGGVGGLGIDLLVQPDDDETAILIPLIASMAGMGIAIGSTRRSPPDLGG